MTNIVVIVAMIGGLLILHLTNYLLNHFWGPGDLVNSLLMNPYLSIMFNAAFVVMLIVQMVKPQRRHLYFIVALLVPVWMSFFSMTFSERTGELMLRYGPFFTENRVKFSDLKQLDIHFMHIVVTTENGTMKYYTPFIDNNDIRAQIYGNCQSFVDSKCRSYQISYP